MGAAQVIILHDLAMRFWRSSHWEAEWDYYTGCTVTAAEVMLCDLGSHVIESSVASSWFFLCHCHSQNPVTMMWESPSRPMERTCVVVPVNSPADSQYQPPIGLKDVSNPSLQVSPGFQVFSAEATDNVEQRDAALYLFQIPDPKSLEMGIFCTAFCGLTCYTAVVTMTLRVQVYGEGEVT